MIRPNSSPRSSRIVAGRSSIRGAGFTAMRTSRCVPPVPGRTPRVISGNPILPPPRRATRRSAAIAISRPPPTVWPFIAAITSFGVCSRRESVSLAWRQKKYLKVGVISVSILIFAPAEKNFRRRRSERSRERPHPYARRGGAIKLRASSRSIGVGRCHSGQERPTPSVTLYCTSPAVSRPSVCTLLPLLHSNSPLHVETFRCAEEMVIVPESSVKQSL